MSIKTNGFHHIGNDHGSLASEANFLPRQARLDFAPGGAYFTLSVAFPMTYTAPITEGDDPVVDFL
jgi:hypothetical protein